MNSKAKNLPVGSQKETNNKNTCFTIFFASLAVLLAACLVNFASDSNFSIANINFLSFRSNSNLNNNNQEKEDIKMAAADNSDNSWKNAKTIYEFKAKDIDGNQVDLSKYKDRVVLIVNVACLCGFTAGNYPQLQELHEKYNDKGLSVVAFPCNQFGGQEPNSEAEIKEFVKQYDVKFDMYSKIEVNGDNAHPLYKFLKAKQHGIFGEFIKWNFSKFLVDRNGAPVNRYAPTTSPKDIEKDIVNLLNAKSSL